MNTLKTLEHIVKTKTPMQIGEHYVDAFTAQLLMTVAHKLSDQNRSKFLNESVDRMVALAYKIVTHK